MGTFLWRSFPNSSVGKESTRNAGDSGLIPGLGRSAEEGTGYSLQYSWASLVAQLVKNPPAKQETWVQILGSNPWTRERLPTPVFWLGEFHGLYSPQGCKESDTTEQLSHSCGACVRLIFLVQSLFFSMDACHVFPQYVLALIPFIRVGAVVTRACTVCWLGPPLYSVAVTVLSGAESAPQLLGVETPKVKVKLLSRARLFVTPWIVACTKLLCPWDFQGKSTGVGCHFLLQGIFPTQGSNPGLWHCRQTLYHLSHQGSPIETPRSNSKLSVGYMELACFCWERNHWVFLHRSCPQNVTLWCHLPPLCGLTKYFIVGTTLGPASVMGMQAISMNVP